MKNKIWVSIIGGLIAGFLNGLFGSGGGTLVVPFMTELLGVSVKKAHATAILIISAFTVVSLIFYGMNSMLDYKLALYVSAGGVVGGFLGAKLLPKISDNVIRKIFGAFMIIASIRMVFK
ncbi:MAG: sulfite exporter TauE/SafE family protein [Clostridia bacterium]|nr:sulfite exporter TauE/SafE family protein [Clostridia bacterium]